jgi:hypothetical protein
MGLKEPVLLNDLVGWQLRGSTAAQIAPVLDDGLALLARPFAAGEAVVIKPSNLLNGMAPAMLTMRPQSRALLLYAPLRTYLGSVAKKGMTGRLWARDLLVKGGIAVTPMGTGPADIGVREGRIVAVGAPATATAETVIDARGLKLMPALLPRVLDETGKPLYTVDSLSADARKTTGVAAYVQSLDEARKSLKAGDKPMVIKAAKANGADVLLAQEEAKKLVSMNPPFLAQGKVVIVFN